MRIFISVDMEGISGVEKVEEVFLGLPAYSTFRQVMAGDSAIAEDQLARGRLANPVAAHRQRLAQAGIGA